MKDILDKTGFSFVWNEENEIKIVLENQMIQKWSEEIKKSKTLKFYKNVKVVYGQEFYFKLNFADRYLTFWLQLRAKRLPTVQDL